MCQEIYQKFCKKICTTDRFFSQSVRNFDKVLAEKENYVTDSGEEKDEQNISGNMNTEVSSLEVGEEDDTSNYIKANSKGKKTQKETKNLKGG